VGWHIAIAVRAAAGHQLASEQLCGDADCALFVGELSLDGMLRHTDGVLKLAHTIADLSG
jgi:magnesium chelatase family protein